MMTEDKQYYIKIHSEGRNSQIRDDVINAGPSWDFTLKRLELKKRLISEVWT